MKVDESVGDMFTIFTNIINSLKAFGRKYTNCEKNAKVSTKAKDFSMLPLDEFLGSIMTNEITMSEHDEKHKKRKTIALKSIIIEDKNEEEDEENEDKDIALITRKFKIFLRKKQGRRDSKYFKNDFYKGDKKNESIICSEFKKPEHVKMECPLLKVNRKFKKRAIKVTWDYIDSCSTENEEEEKVVNMCFMTIDDDVLNR